MLLLFNFVKRRFGEKIYAAANIIVAMMTTDAPDGRSKIYEITSPETQAPTPEAADIKKKYFRLYVN